MTQSDVSDMAFSPTQDMIEQHERWLDKYEKTILKAWKDQGADLSDPDVPKALSAIREEMRVPERPQWMAPGRALAIIVAWVPPQQPHELIDFQDAIRTRAGFTTYEWRPIVAAAMGLGVGSAKLYEANIEPDDGQKTYLYRFFDADDRLLYIGIARDPAERFEWHEKNSMWWNYATRREIEEKTSRKQAYRDETKAIQTERPIFNKVASRRDHNDAVRYIMARSSLEPDTLF